MANLSTVTTGARSSSDVTYTARSFPADKVQPLRFSLVLKSRADTFAEYLRPKYGFPIPLAEVAPVFEVDGWKKRYGSPP